MGNSSSKPPEASDAPEEHSGPLEPNQNPNLIVTEEVNEESTGPDHSEEAGEKPSPPTGETEPVNDPDNGQMYSNVEVIGSLDEFDDDCNNEFHGPKSEDDNHVFSKCPASDRTGKQPGKIQKCGSESLENEELDLQGLDMVEPPKSRAVEPKPDISVLLVGLIGSGKSTLKKHIQLCLGSGFSIEDRKEYRKLIRRYILEQSLELVIENWSFLNSLETEQRQPFTQYMQYCISKEIKIRPYIPLCGHTQDALKGLWNEPKFQEMYKNNPVWRDTSLDLFCSRVAEIGNDGYLPTDVDIMRYFGCLEKHKTLSIKISKPKSINLEVSEFRQPKSAQLKRCNVAIFCVDLSQLDTDHHKCSLKASLMMFNSLINQPDLENKPVFLFFVKLDVLTAKLSSLNIRAIFPKFDQPINVENVTQHILSMFKERFDGKDIKCYVLNALDFQITRKILEETFEILRPS